MFSSSSSDREPERYRSVFTLGVAYAWGVHPSPETGATGLIERNKNILEARTKLFKDYADGHFMTIYGEPVPQLVELAKATHWNNT